MAALLELLIALLVYLDLFMKLYKLQIFLLLKLYFYLKIPA